jgi:hypothetical protein
MADSSASLSVSLTRLWFGLGAAPLAWLLVELVGYILVSQSCTPGQNGLGAYGVRHPGVALVILDLLMALIAVGGLAVACGMSRQLSQVPPSEAGAPAMGRARFMAFAGVLVSAVFLLGILFFGIPPAFVNTCSEVR